MFAQKVKKKKIMRLRSPWLLLFHASGEQTAGAIRLNSSEIWFPTRVIPESLSQGLPGKGLWVLELSALQASSAWRADHFLKGTSKSAKGSWELAVALRHYEQCECVCVCKSMRGVCVCVFSSVQLWVVRSRGEDEGGTLTICPTSSHGGGASGDW